MVKKKYQRSAINIAKTKLCILIFNILNLGNKFKIIIFYNLFLFFRKEKAILDKNVLF